MADQKRHPAGTPRGGEFALGSKADPEIEELTNLDDHTEFYLLHPGTGTVLDINDEVFVVETGFAETDIYEDDLAMEEFVDRYGVDAKDFLSARGFGESSSQVTVPDGDGVIVYHRGTGTYFALNESLYLNTIDIQTSGEGGAVELADGSSNDYDFEKDIKSYLLNYDKFINSGFETKTHRNAEARLDKIERKIREKYGEDGFHSFITKATKQYDSRTSRR